MTDTHQTGSRADVEVVDLGGPNGRILLKFLESIKQRAEQRIGVLPSADICKAEWLLGVEFWQQLSTGERIRAGRSLSFLAERGDLPLERLPKERGAALYYKLPIWAATTNQPN